MAGIGHPGGDFAGHSLRRGHATSAAHGGAPERTIMATTGHRSTRTVRSYIEDGQALRRPLRQLPRPLTVPGRSVAWSLGRTAGPHGFHLCLSRSPSPVLAGCLTPLLLERGTVRARERVFP